MNIHRRVGPIVSDGQKTSEHRMSCIRTLKIFGGLHIGLGVICGILCVVGAVLSAEDMNRQCDYNNYYGYYGYDGYYGNYGCTREKKQWYAFVHYVYSQCSIVGMGK